MNTERGMSTTGDNFATAMCQKTAASLTKLMGLRGLSGSIEWNAERGIYIANGSPCGPSVHGVYDWMNAQPGVLP